MNEEISKIDILGWYGAVVASLGILLSMYNLLRDKAKISIKYEFDQYLIGDGAKIIYNQKNPEQKYVIITVVNKGRRPVKVEQAALKIFHQKKWVILADSFSKYRQQVINEEQPRTQFCAEQQLIDLKNVIYVRVKDGSGRVYKKYIKKIPTAYILIDWFRFKFKKKENNK